MPIPAALAAGAPPTRVRSWQGGCGVDSAREDPSGGGVAAGRADDREAATESEHARFYSSKGEAPFETAPPHSCAIIFRRKNAAGMPRIEWG